MWSNPCNLGLYLCKYMLLGRTGHFLRATQSTYFSLMRLMFDFISSMGSQTRIRQAILLVLAIQFTISIVTSSFSFSKSQESLDNGYKSNMLIHTIVASIICVSPMDTMQSVTHGYNVECHPWIQCGVSLMDTMWSVIHRYNVECHPWIQHTIRFFKRNTKHNGRVCNRYNIKFRMFECNKLPFWQMISYNVENE